MSAKEISDMKSVFYIFLFVIICSACRKEKDLYPALIGLWVGKNHIEDTLLIYKVGKKNVLFDNSAVYRSNPSMQQIPTANKFEFILKDQENKIGVKFLNAPADLEYVEYPFRWITFGEEFSISQNAIRPYLSSIGNIIYVRAR